MAALPSNVDFIRSRIGRNWVIARRTGRIVARYGEDVVCLSPKAYAAIQAEYATLVETHVVATIAESHGADLIEALRLAYRAGKAS